MENLNFGFVVLCPEHNISCLKSTVRHMKNRSKNASIIAVTDDSVKKDQLKEMETICPVYVGGKTITSLINKGMEKGHDEWNIFVVAGAFIPYGIKRKYSLFCENEKDILFPLAFEKNRNGRIQNMNSDFINATLNGLMIHKDTFKKIGSFSNNPLCYSKMIWADQAIEQKCKFKAILGIRIC